MAEKPNKQSPEVKKNDDTASVIAGIFGLSDRQVRRVINGDSENEDVLTAAIFYKREKSKLIKSIEELVPFN